MTSKKSDAMLDDVINRLKSQNEKQIIDSILVSLDSLHRDRKEQIKSLVSTNTQLEQDIQHLQRQISLLYKFNDYTFQLIKNMSVIEGIDQQFDFTKNDDISRVIKQLFNRLTDLNISISKELTDLEQINISYASQKINLDKQNEEIQKRIDHVYEEGRDRDLIAQDANVIKICLYRNLGIRMENLKNDSEEADTILISNGENVNIIKIDDEYDDFFMTNQIWSQL